MTKYAEQITAYEAKRAALVGSMDAIMSKAACAQSSALRRPVRGSWRVASPVIPGFYRTVTSVRVCSSNESTRTRPLTPAASKPYLCVW